MLSRLCGHKNVSGSKRVLKELTVGWAGSQTEDNGDKCDESLGLRSQRRLGSEGQEWASPGGGITYNIIVPTCRHGSRGSERVRILLKVTLLGSGPDHFSSVWVEMGRFLHYS